MTQNEIQLIITVITLCMPCLALLAIMEHIGGDDDQERVSYCAP